MEQFNPKTFLSDKRISAASSFSFQLERNIFFFERNSRTVKEDCARIALYCVGNPQSDVEGARAWMRCKISRRGQRRISVQCLRNILNEQLSQSASTNFPRNILHYLFEQKAPPLLKQENSLNSFHCCFAKTSFSGGGDAQILWVGETLEVSSAMTKAPFLKKMFIHFLICLNWVHLKFSLAVLVRNLPQHLNLRWMRRYNHEFVSCLRWQQAFSFSESINPDLMMIF